jgi:inner membrane protein involved in colicin E2 resistance
MTKREKLRKHQFLREGIDVNNSTIMITILLLGYILIITLRRKNLLDWSNKYPALQYICIGIALIAFVVMLLSIFNVFNFNAR